MVDFCDERRNQAYELDWSKLSPPKICKALINHFSFNINIFIARKGGTSDFFEIFFSDFEIFSKRVF